MPPTPKPQVQALVSYLEHESQPMIVLDSDYNILAANTAYQRQFGTADRPYLGHKCFRVSHHYDVPCDQAGENCPMRKAHDTRGPDRVLHIHHTPRGPEHVNVELRPIVGEQHEVVAYVERLKSLGDKPTNSCTTHFCAADSEGNMVALTQTLMSLFGSAVMLPKTGITMNNGMLWFDPEPNKPNSIAAGKRPLCNICPVVVVKDGQPWFCIGASGGRRIVPAVSQLALMLIDRGMDVEAAFHQPKIDVSGVGPIRVNRDLPDAVKKAIAARLPIVEVTNHMSPLGFANPCAIVRDPATGELTGMNEVMSPWAGGAAQ